MPGFQPDAGELHVDKFLTDLSVGYRNASYVSQQVAPTILVEKESDIIPKYVQDHWFRDVAKVLAPGEVTPRSGFTLNTDTYRCLEYGIGKEIPDRLRDNTDAPYDLDRDAALWVAEMIQLRQEVQFANEIFVATAWTSAHRKAGTTDFVKWSDYGFSDPVADLRAYRRLIRQKIGRHGNTLILGEDVMDTLVDHPMLVERVKYQGGDVSEALIASLLRLDKIVVGSSMQTTVKETTAAQTFSGADLFTDAALLMYIPPAAGLFTPSAVYNFVKRSYGAGMYIRRIRKDEAMKDIIEGRTMFDLKVIDDRAGVHMNDAI